MRLSLRTQALDTSHRSPHKAARYVALPSRHLYVVEQMRWLVALVSILAGCATATDRSPPTDPTSSTGGAGRDSAGAGGAAGDEPAGGDGGGSAGETSSFDALVGTAEDRNDVAGGEVCERIATIQCAGEASCCDEPGRGFEDCKQTMKRGCVDTLLLDTLTANAITGYDRELAVDVFTEYERRARACDVGVAAWGASPEGFRALTRGTIVPGMACKPNGLDIIGQTPTAAAHLFACRSPETHACFPTVGDWTCRAHSGENGECFVDTNCLDGLYCTNSETRQLTGGTCQVRKADGAPCHLPSECDSLACKSGTCAPTTQQNVFCLQ